MYINIEDVLCDERKIPWNEIVRDFTTNEQKKTNKKRKRTLKEKHAIIYIDTQIKNKHDLSKENKEK